MRREGIYKNAFFGPLKACYSHEDLCTRWGRSQGFRKYPLLIFDQMRGKGVLTNWYWYVQLKRSLNKANHTPLSWRLWSQKRVTLVKLGFLCQIKILINSLFCQDFLPLFDICPPPIALVTIFSAVWKVPLTKPTCLVGEQFLQAKLCHKCSFIVKALTVQLIFCDYYQGHDTVMTS